MGLDTSMIGKKVLIIDMDGEPRYAGKSGVVEYVDSMGQLHGTWGGCALIPGVDDYEIIDMDFDRYTISD